MEGAEEAVKFLDAKITETERELESLRQRLTDVESDLRALRKAREVLLEGQADPLPPRKVREPVVEEKTPPLPRPVEVRRGDPPPPSSRPATGSKHGPIKALVLELLREAGKPLHVEELVERLRAAGKATDSATVTITLAEYVKTGKLWRTPQGTYGLPKGFGL